MPDDIRKITYTLNALAQKDPFLEVPDLDADVDAALRWIAERSDDEVSLVGHVSSFLSRVTIVVRS